MNNPLKFPSLKTVMNAVFKAVRDPALVKMAMALDYVQVFDDRGDLFIILGRNKDNPHNLARDCVIALRRLAGVGKLYEDENGRTVLMITPKKNERGEEREEHTVGEGQ